MRSKTKKLIWLMPVAAAFAVVGALAIFIALTPNEAAAQSVPAPGLPQNFTASAESETIIKLDWDAPASSTAVGRQTRYRIDHSSDGMTWELLSDSISGQDSEYRHAGLMARQTVHYRIFALNSGGTQISSAAMSSPASIATMASTRPDAPEDVSAYPGAFDDVEATPAADATERTQITLRWEPPITPDGTTIHQYKVAYAQDPGDLSLSQVRTLRVVTIPTDAAGEVYCGYSGVSGAVTEVGCRYTFTELLEHQTWHFQVYALNQDSSGDVGTSNPSDTKSATTEDSVLPNFGKVSASNLTLLGGKDQVHANPFAAVKKTSPGIFVSWNAPADPEGAPVTDYIVHARPIADTSGNDPAEDNTNTDITWGINNPRDNAIIYHDGETTDLLLTDAQAELSRAARVVWNADARLSDANKNLNRTIAPTRTLNFETYLNNLQWEVRVIAVNRVWSREVQNVPQAFAKALAHGTLAASDFTPTTGDLEGLNAENLENDTLINASPAIHVSLNELSSTIDPATNGIAPTKVDLQKPVEQRSFRAVRDNDTHGGRTKIDLMWTRTDDGRTPTSTVDPYAMEYRIQYSTDRKTWTPLDSDTPATPNGHQDFDTHSTDVNGGTANCNRVRPDDTANTVDAACSVSHEGLAAGTTYYYRLFAANMPTTNEVNGDNGTDGTATDLHTVFSTSVSADATTVQAKKPGRPTALTATHSQEDGHTMIDLEWTKPTLDADGEGDGDGYGSIVGYIVAMSNDGGKTWTEERVDGMSHTHEGLKPGEAWRYRVRTVNEGPAEKMSDWSDTTTLSTVKSFVPDKPEGLVAEGVSPTSIKLRWNIQSRTPPAAPVDAYLVEYQDGASWKLLATVMDEDGGDGRPATYYVDNSLAPNEKRTYRVVAQNEPEVGKKARSPESDSVSATTMDAMVPGAPTGVTATADSPTAITVKWTAPTDNGGTAITGYKVMWKMSSADAYADADMMMTAADADPVPTTLQVTGLTEGTEYTFTVKAVNAKGDSEASAVTDDAKATTPVSNTPPKPTDATIPAFAVKVDETVTSAMTAETYFTDDDGDTLKFSAESLDGSIATATITDGKVSVTGVEAGSTTVEVTATDPAGATAKQSAKVTVSLVLTAPIITLANPVGSSSVGVDWTPVSGATSYVLYAVHLENGDIEARDVPPGQTSFSISGLVVDDEYLIFVGVFSGAANYKLSDPERVTVE